MITKVLLGAEYLPGQGLRLLRGISFSVSHWRSKTAQQVMRWWRGWSLWTAIWCFTWIQALCQTHIPGPADGVSLFIQRAFSPRWGLLISSYRTWFGDILEWGTFKTSLRQTKWFLLPIVVCVKTTTSGAQWDAVFRDFCSHFIAHDNITLFYEIYCDNMQMTVYAN